jgi:hypothetical protein
MVLTRLDVLLNGVIAFSKNVTQAFVVARRHIQVADCND